MHQMLRLQSQVNLGATCSARRPDLAEQGLDPACPADYRALAVVAVASSMAAPALARAHQPVRRGQQTTLGSMQQRRVS
jgi:hypothetical protein